MSATDIPYAREVTAKQVTGVIANTPAAVGDPLYVRLPSYGTQATHLAAHWDPHGATLPAAGAACLVGIDQDDGKWVLSWVGGWS